MPVLSKTGKLPEIAENIKRTIRPTARLSTAEDTKPSATEV
jgi:hypothetical protein